MRRFTVALLAVVLWACGAGQAGDVRSLTILHTSDLHARLLPDKSGQGGFAQMATAIRGERERSDTALVLHGGDLVQGSPVSTIFKGQPVVEIANTLGIDVHTLGNHEFDYGWRRILEFVAAGRFDTVSANVVNERGETLASPWVIKTVNGVRVGVIGIMTERLDSLTQADLRGPWKVANIVETVGRYVAELRSQTDLIVVLAHCFDDEDSRILKELKEVAIVVSGHNHGGYQELKVVDGRLAVKVRAYGRELGRLDLEYDLDERKVVSYDWRRIAVTVRDHPADPETARLVEYWEAKVAAMVDQKIGISRSTLRKPELRELIEQAMREAAPAEMAYMNEGGIRDSLYEGDILRRHIWNILPFGNELAVGRIRGDRLPRELAETIQVDPNREYTVATNSFIAEKWAERGVLLEDSGELVRDLVIEYIERLGEIR